MVNSLDYTIFVKNSVKNLFQERENQAILNIAKLIIL